MSSSLGCPECGQKFSPTMIRQKDADTLLIECPWCGEETEFVSNTKMQDAINYTLDMLCDELNSAEQYDAVDIVHRFYSFVE